MGPKDSRRIHITSDQMRDAYLEQNPDHKEEFEKHNNKNKDRHSGEEMRIYSSLASVK